MDERKDKDRQKTSIKCYHHSSDDPKEMAEKNYDIKEMEEGYDLCVEDRKKRKPRRRLTDDMVDGIAAVVMISLVVAGAVYWLQKMP